MGVHLQAELEQGLVVKTRLCSQFFFFCVLGFIRFFFLFIFYFLLFGVGLFLYFMEQIGGLDGVN